MTTTEETIEKRPNEGSSPLEAGQVVGGKFRLDRFVARGGMGTVWAATHLILASQVAIKFLDRLRGGDADDIALRVDRFRFEAQISARLAAQTQHMVAVHDAGVHRGMPYLVMEFAPGKSLQDLLDERERLSPSALLPVVEQIGQALDASHRAGIVHRDVKPGNILFLDRRGSRASMTDAEDTGVFTKLTDFGVAKPSDGSEIDLVAPMQTAEGLVVGSPAYMSPEQIAGTGFSTGASDRWALGVVIYEAVTGWLPFRGESLTDFAVGITTRAHDPPTSVVDDLPRALDAFFDRALAKQAKDRYGSCAEMAKAFRDALETPKEPVAPALPIEKSRLPWIVGAGVAAVAITGLILLALGGEKPVTPAADTGASASTPATTAAPPPTTVATTPEPPPSTPAPEPSASSSSSPTKKPRKPPSAATGPGPTPGPGRTPKPIDPSDVH